MHARGTLPPPHIATAQCVDRGEEKKEIIDKGCRTLPNIMLRSTHRKN